MSSTSGFQEGGDAGWFASLSALLCKNKKSAFNQAFNRLIEDPERLGKLCDEVKRIGPPNYYPSYIILHGLKAFMGNPHQDALVKNFDATGSWNNLQSEYLHCPN